MQHVHPPAESGPPGGFFANLFGTDFVPRAQCFNQDADVIWVHLASDIAIAVAYYSIPIALLYFVSKRRDLAFHWIFLLFGGFILLCGTTHLFNILAIWRPVYRLDGVVKAVTGIFSIGTATILWPLVPRALALPSPEHLRKVNAALAREIVDRQDAQEGLQRARDELERRVAERTTELAATNIALQAEVAQRGLAQRELSDHRDHLERLIAERTHELGVTHERLRAQERMAAIGTLSAGLGHDMGNLLLPVQARLDSIAGEAVPEPAREDIAVIRTCVKHLQRLSSGLRLLALDPSSGEASARQTRVAEWWSDVEPLFRSALPRGVTIQARLDPGVSSVRVARHALTQALFNLVQNAGDAFGGRAEGRITVWTEPGDTSGWVRIGVTDDGPGMSPEVRARCLEPFFTTKTRGLSTGLGLALVHSVAQRVGGTIEVRSQPGEGTTFILTLPAAPPDMGDTLLSPGRPGAVVTIRDPRRRSFVAGALATMGFRVDERRTVPEVSDHHCLWVLDAEPGAEERAKGFLGLEGRRAVVIFGDKAERQPMSGWFGIPDAFKPTAIRDALHEAARVCGVREEGA